MRYIILTFLLFGILACNNNEANEDSFSYLPDAVGGYSTLNIIADENLWNYGLKKLVEPIFTKEINGLLNREPEFDIQAIRSKSFNRLFQRQRHLLLFIESKKAIKEGLSVKKNVYANGQIIVQVSGNSKKAILQLFQEKKSQIFQLFDSHRTLIIQKLAKVNNNNTLEEKLSNNHGIKLVIPQSYQLAIDSTNFFYVSKKAKIECEKFNHGSCYIQTGIFTYFFNYSSKEIFTPSKFIAIRDSITKQYVEGNSGNNSLRSYMKVYKGLPVSTKDINLDGKYAFEVKGWWDLQNGTMGGPFVSIAFVDELRNRVIVVDGFVFGPNFNKRRFIKELEAICLSIRAN
tara:strand:- start:1855 stop:2889 length:1035 start_codon:yes stop_codon:yes gene_type:complete